MTHLLEEKSQRRGGTEPICYPSTNALWHNRYWCYFEPKTTEHGLSVTQFYFKLCFKFRCCNHSNCSMSCWVPVRAPVHPGSLRVQLFSQYRALQLQAVLLLLCLVTRGKSPHVALPCFTGEWMCFEAAVLLTSQFSHFFYAVLVDVGYLQFFYLPGSSG